MSYILDALRKSEQERQVAAGRGTGMLFPVATETRPGIGRPLILLGSIALILVLAFNGWSWWRLSTSAKPAPVVLAAQAPPPALPAPVTTPAVTALPPRQAVEPLTAAPPPQPAERKPAPSASPKPAAAPEKPVKMGAPEPAAPSPATRPARSETSTEAPKGLPSVSISGYIKDEGTGNLAIINDRVVREGEEILPGLRLEKIDGESAVLNYKGQRFRR